MADKKDANDSAGANGHASARPRELTACGFDLSTLPADAVYERTIIRITDNYRASQLRREFSPK